MRLPWTRQNSGVSAQPCPPDEGLLVVPRRGQWAMMISLIFFVGPVVDAADDLDGVELAGALTLSAIFVALYWRTMVGGWIIDDRPVDDDRHAALRIAGLAAIAVGLAAIGGGDWSGTWCFVAAAAGLRIDRRLAI